MPFFDLIPVIFLQVKAKTISEIHSEAEKTLGLRPGSMAALKNGRGGAGAPAGGGPALAGGGFPIARPGAGGMMPGMPGLRKMPGMPSPDGDNWEVPRTRSMPRGAAAAAADGQLRHHSPLLAKPSATINTRLLPQGSGGLISGKTSAFLQGSTPPPLKPAVAPPAPVAAPPPPTPAAEKPSPAPAPAKPSATANLQKKTVSLLEEYFSVGLLDEALQCVEELASPEFHPELVKEAIYLALDRTPPAVDPVVKLLTHLAGRNVLAAGDIAGGFVIFAAALDDVGIDLPRAPGSFGEIAGRLVVAGGATFKTLEEALKKIEDPGFRAAVLRAARRAAAESAGGEAVLAAQAVEIAACEALLLS